MSWTKSYSVITKKASAAQLWKLFADVNNWHTWDKGIEFAKMEGAFTAGNHFTLRPKGGPTVNIKIIETVEGKKFVDCTKFPLAKMYGEHLYEETKDGLRMTTTMTVEGILGFLWVKIVAQGIVDALPADMEAQIEAASKL